MNIDTNRLGRIVAFSNETGSTELPEKTNKIVINVLLSKFKTKTKNGHCGFGFFLE